MNYRHRISRVWNDDGKQVGAAMTWLLTFLTIATILLLGPRLTHRWTFHSNSAVAKEMKKDSQGEITPPARDPKLAVEEEYQLALRQGTVQALELFIARHPDDALAEKARAYLRQRTR